MFVGPVFYREAATLPRRPRFYVARTIYASALFGLMVSALILLTGSQNVRNIGDWARFGAKVFQILAPLQLALATFLAAMITSAAVAHEKDRRTLIVLMLTDMSNAELVLGRLLASLLEVLTLVAASAPLFMFVALLGGVSYGQIFSAELITVASVIVAGSLGSTIALWREKTFQTLAMTAMLLFIWLLFWEFVASGGAGSSLWGLRTDEIAAVASPWRAIQNAVVPDPLVLNANSWLSWRQFGFCTFAVATSIFLNLLAILRVRAWNTSAGVMRHAAPNAADESTVAGDRDVNAGRGRKEPRAVWSNPILWREIRTWAYGKKILVIRAAYVLIAVAALFAAISAASPDESIVFDSQLIPDIARPLVPLFAVSVLLVNALAVTAITNERDGQALDLLLVTDLSAKEFIYGKLGGVLYNAKEMILLPVVLAIYIWIAGYMDALNLTYLVLGYLVMVGFASMLGVHCGISYAGSRTAVGTSLGTMMFLFLGVATCMRMMIAFKGSYLYQLGAFSSFLVGGGIGLYFALGWRNPSQAIFSASFIAPVATFFVITSFLLGQYGACFLVTTVVYGGATLAMLLPAIAEFDVALGRTSGADGD